MKKSFLTLAAFAAFAFVSCTIEDVAPVTPGEEKLIDVVITASADATKATLDGNTPAWEVGDEIAVWDGVAVRKFTNVSGCEFAGSVAENTTDIEVAYPYTENRENGRFWQLPPAEQVITAGRAVDSKALMQVGSGKINETVHLKNDGCLVRFTVEDGATEVILHNGCWDDSSLAAGSPCVTVKVPGNGVYNAVVWHCNYGFPSFRVFAKKGDKYYVKHSSSEIVFRDGKGVDMGVVDNGEEATLIFTGDDFVEYISNPVLNAYQMTSIDLSGKTLPVVTDFSKKYDGQFFYIANWVSDGEPLFRSVAAEGQVRQVCIEESCKFTPKPGDSGVIVGNNKGKVEICINSATITPVVCDETAPQYRFGGVVGLNNNYMKSCDNYSKISFTFNGGVSGTQYIGGVVGVVGTPQTGDRVVGCYNFGEVEVNGKGALKSYYVGGVVGATGVNAGSSSTTSGYTKHYGNIRDGYNYGKITVDWAGGTGGYIRVGGIVGYCEGSIIHSKNYPSGAITLNSSKTVSSSSPCVGGIAGVLAGPGSYADECVNKAPVSVTGMFGNASNDYGSGVGGIKYACSGGVIGQVGDNVTDEIKNCVNDGQVTIDAQMGTSASSSCAYGGVIGYSKAPLNGCENKGLVSISTGSKTNYNGGVVGYAKGALTNCSNTGARTAFAGMEGFSGNQAYQLYTGGVCGYLDAPADTEISGCTNTSPITFANAANAVFHYVGGILGSYKNAVDIKDCACNADVTSTSASGVRLGGIAGAINGKATDCSYSGTLSLLNATSEADKPASAGLVTGYLNGKVSGCTLSGSMVSTAVAETFVGGVVGSLGSSSEDKSISGTNINVAVTNTNSTVGYLVGRIHSASSFCTLGAEGAPVKINKASNINGTAIANTDAATLIGTDNGSTNIKVNNVVIE